MFRSSFRWLCATAASSSGSTVTPDVLAIAKAQALQLDNLSPQKIASLLDDYVVGQADAKRAVSISLRNRWRRRQLKDDGLRGDIVPKNMLLVGPTGVGKTEIARRMAKLTNAPFVKVEATKYTEVGFKGKDVEQIIEDLYTNAKSRARRFLEAEREPEALAMALDVIFSLWATQRRAAARVGDKKTDKKADEKTDEKADDRAPLADVSFSEFKKRYKTDFKDDIVTVEVMQQVFTGKPNVSPGGIDMQAVGMMLGFGVEPRRVKKPFTRRVEEAVPLAMQEALDRLVDESQVNTLARTLAEQDGIVVIDEIDKVVVEAADVGSDVSATGVQQDLLPLIEGSYVNMKDGSQINTDNILFICAGAFHSVKPSAMIAELQGRLPVRVELKALSRDDIRRILREPKYNLLRQQIALLKTEGIEVEFTDDAVEELASVTASVNSNGQNIGARRLHTIIERVMDEYSFNCQDYEGKKVIIDANIIRNATKELQKNINLAKYLL